MSTTNFTNNLENQNEPITKNNALFKSQRKEMKRKPVMEGQADTSVFNARLKLKNQIKELKEQQTLELQNAAAAAASQINENRIDSVSRAIDNKIGYLRRTHNKVRTVVSPRQHYLNLSEDFSVKISLNDRIRFRNKVDRCMCDMGLKKRKPGIWKNQLKYDDVEKKFVFSCTHKSDKFVQKDQGVKCMSCGSQATRKYATSCGCDYHLCENCTASNFSYIGDKQQLIVQLFDKHAFRKYNVFCETKTIEFMGIPIKKEVDKKFKIPAPMFVPAKYIPKISRKAFRESLKTETGHLSYAKALALNKPVQMDTVPEGGAVSSAASGVKSFTKSGVATATSAMNKTLDASKKLLSNLTSKLAGVVTPEYKMIHDFISVLSYLVEKIIYYSSYRFLLDLVLLLEELFYHGGKIKSVALVMGMLSTVTTLEEISLLKIKQYQSRYLDVDELKYSQFGAFTCDLLHYAAEHEHMERYNGVYIFTDECVEYIKDHSLSKMLGMPIDEEESSCDFLFGFCNQMKEWLPKNLIGSVKNFGIMVKEFLPAVTFTNGIFTLGKNIYSVFYKLFGSLNGENYVKYALKDKDHPIAKVQAAAIAYNASFLRNDSPETSTEIRQKLYMYLGQAEERVSQDQQYSPYYKSWKDHMQKLADTPPSVSERDFEPFCLALLGKPGIGKSAGWPILVGHTIDKTVTDVRKLTHTWNMSSDYQTGIIGKKVILFDDFAQDRENRSDVLHLISLMTSAPFVPNLAAITGAEIKGLQIDPDFVVLCTNDKNLGADKVHSSEAVHRRVDLMLEMIKTIPYGEPDALEVKAFRVLKCAMYDDLVGKELTTQQAMVITKFLSTQKKKNLSEIKKAQDNPRYKEYANKKVLIDPKKIEFDFAAKKFEEDFKAYVEGKEITTLKKVVERRSDKSTPGYNHSKNKSNHKINKAIPLQDYLSKEQAKSQAPTEIPRSSLNDMDVEESTTAEWLIKEALNMITLGTYLNIAAATVCAASLIVDQMASVYSGRTTIGPAIISMLKTTLAAVLGIAGGLWVVKKLAYPEDYAESGTTKTAKAKSAVMKTAAESGPFEQLVPVYKSAMGFISSSDKGNNVVFVGGTYILTVAHFFNTVHDDESTLIKEGTELKLTKHGWRKSVPFKFEHKRLITFPNTSPMWNGCPVRPDVVLYKLDEKIFHQSKNIVKHFWDGGHSIQNFEVTKIDLINNFDLDNPFEFNISSGKVEYDQVYTRRVKGNDVYYHSVAAATYVNRSNSCGSPIMLDETAQLLGIHVAARHGSQKLSMFHFVTRKELEDAMSEGVDVEQSNKLIVNPDIAYNDNGIPRISILQFEGTVDKKYRVFQNRNTDLTPSNLYELFGDHTTEPAILHPSDPRLNDFPERRDNFYRDLYAGFGRIVNIPPEDLVEATQSLIREQRAASKESKIKNRILNEREILNGIPEYPGSSAIDLSTSSGWPYSPQGIKRKDLIELCGTEDNRVLKFRREYKEEFDRVCNMVKDGIVPFLPFQTSIKDERKKLSKIYQTTGSRVFMNASITHLLLCRKYFHTYVVFVYNQDRHFAPMKLDRISIDWHNMITELLTVGDKACDGDFKDFDKSLQGPIMGASIEVVLDFIKGVISEKEYQVLYQLLFKPYMVFGDKVYSTTGCNPSGQLLTYLINCIANEIMHRTAYLIKARELKPNFGTISAYLKYTRGRRGGDDDINVMSDAVIDFYNGVTIGEVFSRWGIQYTSADKSDNIVPYKKIEDVSFLKMFSKVNEEGIVLPIVNLTEAIESFYWIRVSKLNRDKRALTQANVNSAMRSIFFHGRKVYNEIRDKILDKDPRLDILSYTELLNIWNNYNYFPGAHSDYATYADQAAEFDDNVKPKQITGPVIVKESDKIMRVINNEFNQKGITSNFGTLETAAATGKFKIVEFERTINGVTTIGRTLAPIDMETTPESGGNNLVAEAMSNVVSPKPDNVVDSHPVKDTPVSSNATVGTKTESQGTTIVTQEPTQKLVPIAAGKPVGSTNMRAEGHVNDKNWTLESLEQKHTLLKSFDWSISDPQMAVLAQWDIPNDILVTPAMQTPFEVTAFWRGKEVTIKLGHTASQFYSGALVIGFLPYMRKVTSISRADIEKSIQMGAAILKVSDNQTIEYTIPFRHYLGYLEYPNDFLGTCFVAVLNQLDTGATNKNQISINAYINVKGSEFKVPEFVEATTGPKTQRYLEHTKYSMEFSSYPESGPMRVSGTEISSTTEKIDINMNIDMMPTIKLCAGAGMTSEPAVKQFADMPQDIVVLEKRYLSKNSTQYTIPAYDAGPGELIVKRRITDIVQEMWISDMFMLWRGSINGKIDVKNLTSPASIEGKVFLLTAKTPAPTDPVAIEAEGKLMCGNHRFNTQYPAEFNIPYTHMNFVALVSDSGYLDPQAVNQSELVFVLQNFSPSEVKVWVEEMYAAGDDFKMGVFRGVSNLSLLDFEESGWNDSNWQQEVKSIVTSNAIVAETSKEMDSEPESGVLECMGRILDNVIPEEYIEGAVGSLLDKPMLTVEPEPMKLRQMGYTTPCVGAQYEEKLKCTTTNGLNLPDDECFGTDQNETNMYLLMQKVKTVEVLAIQWPETLSAQTLLWSQRVGPLGGTPYEAISPLDRFAKHFDFWQGSITYVFDVVAAATHKGKLLISWHPNLTIPPSSMKLATQQYFTSVDLSEGKCTAHITVPYLNKNNYLAVVQQQENPSYPTPYGDKQNFNGILCLWVQNELRGSTSAPSKAEINIFKAAGPDFKFASYGSSLNLPSITFGKQTKQSVWISNTTKQRVRSDSYESVRATPLYRKK